MALSWTDARAKVRGDLWKSATALPDEVVNRALHAALLELESERRWLWLENLQLTAVLVAASNTISAPVQCKSITSLAVVTGTNQDILTPLSLGIVKQMAASNVSGSPCNYAFQGGIIHLDAKASIGDRFNIVYKFGTPDDLDIAIVADNPIMALHQQAIIANACSTLAFGRLRNNEVGRAQRALYDTALDRLLYADDEARSDQYGPVILPDSGFRDAAFGN